MTWHAYTLKAPEGGSRSSEATLVYHLLLISVKTISTFKRQVVKLYWHTQKASELAYCVIVIKLVHI